MHKSVLAIFVSCMFFIGCAASLNEFISENRKNLSRLSPGMSKVEVHAIMGQETVRNVNNPYRSAMQYNKQKEPIEVFYYYTDGTSIDGIQDFELTPVVFLNGKVIGWGREFFTEFVNKYEIRIR